jgi:Zn-dependent M32 family carboxypeptidase
MNSIQLDSANVPSQLVILMQGAKEGRSDAINELTRQLSKYKHPKTMLKQLAKELKRTEERREEKRVAQSAAREKYRINKFAPTHPIFRKSRAKKGARRTDAFAYRVILCGGFETNRRRH